MLLLTILLVQTILTIFISGILYSFSDFIMKAFNALPSKNAVAAMQSINTTVYRSIFMVIFISLVPISIITTIWSVVTLGWTHSLFVILGALFYIVGTFIITGVGNVPLNKLLEQVDVSHQEVNSAWKNYYARWTRLNTIRCIFGILAGLSYALAVYLNL